MASARCLASAVIPTNLTWEEAATALTTPLLVATTFLLLRAVPLETWTSLQTLPNGAVLLSISRWERHLRPNLKVLRKQARKNQARRKRRSSESKAAVRRARVKKKLLRKIRRRRKPPLNRRSIYLTLVKLLSPHLQVHPHSTFSDLQLNKWQKWRPLLATFWTCLIHNQPSKQLIKLHLPSISRSNHLTHNRHSKCHKVLERLASILQHSSNNSPSSCIQVSKQTPLNDNNKCSPKFSKSRRPNSQMPPYSRTSIWSHLKQWKSYPRKPHQNLRLKIPGTYQDLWT